MCFVDVVLGVVEVGLEDCVPDVLGEVFFVGAGWECVYCVGDCAWGEELWQLVLFCYCYQGRAYAVWPLGCVDVDWGF